MEIALKVSPMILRHDNIVCVCVADPMNTPARPIAYYKLNLVQKTHPNQIVNRLSEQRYGLCEPDRIQAHNTNLVLMMPAVAVVVSRLLASFAARGQPIDESTTYQIYRQYPKLNESN